MAYTGYKIITYIDVNPQSPTFQTQRTERVRDDENCGVASANWEVISYYCELDGSGSNTGYYVTQEMDTNLDSPTYGQTRENKEYNVSQCPLKDPNPHWVINLENSYCEKKTFPSGVEGNTGKYIVELIDENSASPTFNQKKESSYTESDWTEEMTEAFGEFPCKAPDTEPQIEEISSSCVMVTCSGKTTTNGQKKIFGLDKNIYSMTYLQSMETIITDEDTCPNGCSGGGGDEYIFTWSDGTTTMSKNVSYEAQTVSVGVVSTKNGSSQDWSVSSGSATKSSTGISVSLTENTSTASTKTTSITLKQSESNKTIMLSIIQAKKKDTCTPSQVTYYTVTSSKTNPSTVAATVTSSTLSWNYNKTTDYVYADCSTSSTTQSGTSSTTVTFSENTSTSSTTRSGNVTWTGYKNKNGNTITIPWSVTQQGKEITDAFTFADGTTSKTLNVSSGNTTQTIDIISIVGGTATDLYSLVEKTMWIQYNSHTATNFKITVERNDTGSARSGYISLKQNATNKTIRLDINQSAGTNYAFSYGDGTTSKLLSVASGSSSGSYSVTSTRDGSSQGWSVTEKPNWVSVTSNTSTLNWSVTPNSLAEVRSGTVTSTQDESLKTITLDVEQAAGGGTPSTVGFCLVTQMGWGVMAANGETFDAGSTANVAGGPTNLWLSGNTTMDWNQVQIDATCPSGMIEINELMNKMTQRAKLNLYWTKNDSGVTRTLIVRYTYLPTGEWVQYKVKQLTTNYT